MCYGWEIVETIKILKDYPIKGVIIGYGDGIPILQKMAADYGIADKIVFIGKIPYREIPQYLELIDICISTQTNNLAGRVRTTGKLPLYLACNKFIIATNVGEAELVYPEEMLISYDGIRDLNYPQRLADKVLEIQKHPEIMNIKETGLAIAEKYFTYNEISKKAASIVKAIVNDKV